MASKNTKKAPLRLGNEKFRPYSPKKTPLRLGNEKFKRISNSKLKRIYKLKSI